MTNTFKDKCRQLQHQVAALESSRAELAREVERLRGLLREARYSPMEGQDEPESRFICKDQPEWIGDRVFLTIDLCERIDAALGAGKETQT